MTETLWERAQRLIMDVPLKVGFDNQPFNLTVY